MGAQLAGMRSALVMQNSGIGNLLNGWASGVQLMGISIPWIVSDRGSMGEQVMTQTIWHGRLRAILKAAQIWTFVSATALPAVASFVQDGYATHQCVAALFRMTSGATISPHAVRVRTCSRRTRHVSQSTWARCRRILAPHGAASRCSKVS